MTQLASVHRPGKSLMLRRLHQVDERISTTLHDHTLRSRVYRATAQIISLTADGWTWFLFLPAMCLAGAIGALSPTCQVEQWPSELGAATCSAMLGLAWDLSLGSLIGTLLEFTVKLVVRRKRPAANTKTFYSFNPEQFSFPSGHTLRAGYICGALLVVFAAYALPSELIAPGGADSYGVDDGVGSAGDAGVADGVQLLVAWVFLVGLARVSLGRHFPTDCAVGGVAGLTLGWAVARFTLLDNAFPKAVRLPSAAALLQTALMPDLL